MATVVLARMAHARSSLRSVVVGLTPDVVAMNTVSHGIEGGATVLCVPANERLQGTLFTPSEAAAAGHRPGIVYAEQTVDGQAHMAGGLALQTELLNQAPINTG
mmetsp:Transcript_31840/g.59334  ORF Transcript_31840/g.59334 Transcript_31840/m.59334 type:complete len:104 (-) Transcript_31840:633-944(-)